MRSLTKSNYGMIFGLLGRKEKDVFHNLITYYFIKHIKSIIMSNTNFPAATTPSQPPRKNYKNAIIGVLAAGLIGVGGYMVYDKNNSGQLIQHQQTEITKVTDEKGDIQKNFNESLAKLDEMKTTNSGLESKLTEKNNEITKVKSEIRSILNKKNATAAELARAKSLITKLNGKIASMEEDIAKLTNENQSLTTDKVALTADKVQLTQDKDKLTQDLATTTTVKENLAKKVDVASTLNASNISIVPLKVRNNGKEKVTSTAKHVDKLKITFDVDNRIAEPGKTDVYVVVIGPDGKPVMMDQSAPATFTTREEGDKSFTAKLPVDIETAKRKTVEFNLTSKDFQQGNYTIQIYQNGFKIGEGTRELKKGGIFG